MTGPAACKSALRGPRVVQELIIERVDIERGKAVWSGFPRL
jgi:hypothetical protein